MISRIFSLLVILIWCAAATGPYAQRFQLSPAVTASDISKSYARRTREQIESKFPGQRKEFREHCEFDGASDFQCFVFDWGVAYLPPYPIALPDHTPTVPTGTSPVWGWVPIEDVKAGRRYLTEWQNLAQVGDPFACIETRCFVLIQALTEDQGVSESSYAVCRVVWMPNVAGAPESCKQIAVIAGDRVWLNAITGSTTVREQFGLPDFSLHVRAAPPGYRLPTKFAFAKAFETAFRSSSLRLDAQTEGEESMTATASYRISPVLPGWREIVTIRLDVKNDGSAIPAGLGIVVATTIYVNRQNTASPEDWRLPNAAQEAAYLARVRELMKLAIGSVCKNAVWLGREEVVCSL